MALAIKRTVAAETASIGDVKDSVLSEAQFILENGTGWCLADGRSIVGSKLHQKYGITTAVDVRGLFRRAANNGRAGTYADPSGNRAVGNIQGHAFQTHTHAQNAHSHSQDSHSHSVFSGNGGGSPTTLGNPASQGIGGTAGATGFGYYLTAPSGGNNYLVGIAPNINNTTATNQNQSATGAASEPTAAESRPVNMAFNVFIKIN